MHEHPKWYHLLEVLPTWLLLVTTRRFLPADHPWRRRKRVFTLYEWAQGALPPLLRFSRAFWACGLTTACLAAVIWWRARHPY
jgi:hypothetical protein